MDRMAEATESGRSGGEVALVTGAAGALGSEVARVLAGAGRRLVLVDSAASGPRLAQLATDLGGAVTVSGDITAPATWSEALPRIERDLGGLPTQAALIAGTYRGGKPLHEETDEVWRTVVSANLETVYRSLRALLPSMVARRKGTIVVIGARPAEQPWTAAGSASYAATKAGVVAMARAVSAEVLEHGVRINAVLPSTMDTPANRAAMPKADPTKWVSLPSAAGLVAFLLGDGARDVSGAAVPLYGRS
jgi:NAD(P)-dependent dehydrogenase (short-subunit alcohol dehydrogenase family)